MIDPDTPDDQIRKAYRKVVQYSNHVYYSNTVLGMLDFLQLLALLSGPSG